METAAQMLHDFETQTDASEDERCLIVKLAAEDVPYKVLGVSAPEERARWC